MPQTVIHDRVVSERFPLHATAVMRIVADVAIRPCPGALGQLAELFAAEGGADNARRGAEYWRQVYDDMGAKPKYRPSLKNLLDHYDENDRLRIPVPLVELYCWYSLVHGVPMAGYRSERLQGALRLTIPGPGHLFTPLGQPRGSQERTKPNEVAYIDDDKTICRYWNYRDCDQTKLVQEVTDAIFVFDLVNEPGLPGINDAESLMAGFVEMIGGTFQSDLGVLDGIERTQVDLL
jgi:DNA/RNA-binding domain of Phe-tRNA-synthetase-like protein